MCQRRMREVTRVRLTSVGSTARLCDIYDVILRLHVTCSRVSSALMILHSCSLGGNVAPDRFIDPGPLGVD